MSEAEQAARHLVFIAKMWLHKRARVWEQSSIEPLFAQSRADILRNMRDTNDALAALAVNASKYVESMGIEEHSGAHAAPTSGTSDSTSDGDTDSSTTTPPLIGVDILCIENSSGPSGGRVAGAIGALGVFALFNPPMAAAAGLHAAFKHKMHKDLARNNIKSKVIEALIDALNVYIEKFYETLRDRVDELSVPLDPHAVETLLVNITALRASVNIIQAFHEAEQEQARVHEETITKLYSQLQSQRSNIDALRRAADPSFKILVELKQSDKLLNDKVSSLIDTIKAASQSSGKQDRSRLVEFHATLQQAGCAHLQMLKKHFQKQRRWQESMEYEIAMIWAWYRKASEEIRKNHKNTKRAPIQESTFRTVTALAIVEGEDAIPEPGIVAEWCNDLRYLLEVIEIHKLLSDEKRDESYYLDEFGKPKPGGGFYGAYKNAHEKVTARPRDGIYRRETVNDPAKDRDPDRFDRKPKTR